MTKLTEDQIKAATQVRIERAMTHVENAQNELLRACNMLSALEHGNKEYSACMKLQDKAHSFWYTVRALRNKRGVRLDRTNIQVIEQDQSRKFSQAKQGALEEGLSEEDAEAYARDQI